MKAGSVIRAEWPGDEPAIERVIGAAFASAAHASGNEGAIVRTLRSAGDLTLSLVATDAARLIGHVAFSPVTIADGTPGWFGLGPVAVLPEVQGHGIGTRLIQAGLVALAKQEARGIVVLGDPAFYGRFGFRAVPGLVYPGVPVDYFQALALAGEMPRGAVRYASAFG